MLTDDTHTSQPGANDGARQKANGHAHDIPSDYLDVPLEMRDAPRWLLWRYQSNEPKKPRKVPFYANGERRHGKLDTDSDRAQLVTFNDAFAALRAGKYDGLGFALGPDGSGSFWQGIDIDNIDEHAELRPTVAALPGYTESSPSGNGVHAIGYGKWFPPLGSNGSGTEAYSNARFFTVTGANGHGELDDIACYVERVLRPLHTQHAERDNGDDSARRETIDADTIRDLRSALAFMRADDYGDWVKFGHCLKRLGDLGRGLWFEWSQTSLSKYDPEAAARAWNSFKGDRAGYRGIFAEAQRRGWVNTRMRREPEPSMDGCTRDSASDAANPCTHLANAHRLRRHFGHGMKYVQGVGWYCYDELRPPWRRSDEAAMQNAQRLGAIVAGEAAAIANREGGASAAGYKERCKWAAMCEQDHCMRASLAQAAALPGMYCTAETMDRDPYLLGTPKEVVDLRTGRARPHRPEDYISRITSVGLDPESRVDRFTDFIHYICNGDAALIDCLQVAFGYASTGLTIEQRMFVPWGTGKNGKTTLLNAIREVLGDYACAAPPNLLVQHRSEHHPTELMELLGRRLVVATESDQYARLNEPAVKQMTGSDPMKGRAMRQDFVQWNPTHKLFLVTNHKPIITGTDEGIWRRIALLPFTATITDEMCKRSREFLDELEHDRPAILQWLVDGARRYFEHGLVLPPSVIDATAEYRSDSDVLGDFLTERCELGRTLKVAASNLRRGYTEWCQENGEHPLGSRALATALAERGFSTARGSGGVRMWKGLQLKGGN